MKKLYNQPEILVAPIATMSVICASGDPAPVSEFIYSETGADPGEAL